LQNASSISSLILTTEAAVAEKPEDDKGGSAMGGMPPGGMPGMM
jgi:chaperonin GroEL